MEIRSGHFQHSRLATAAQQARPAREAGSLEPADSYGTSPMSQAQPLDAYSGPLSAYVDPTAELPPTFPTSAPPVLERPVIFLHGFVGNPESFEPMTQWLSSGKGNKDGGTLEAGKLTEIDGSANLFTLRLSRPYNGIEKNSEELKQTIEAVLKATGQQEVDLVVHSLGGLNSRDYLREPDEKVKRLVMIGTPNHGSQLANLELIFREKFGYPIKPPVDDPEVRTVLNQLRVDRDGRHGPENPYLRELNDGWGQQRSRAEAMTIAGVGIPTLTSGIGVTIRGDGVVARKSAELDGIVTKSAWFKSHGGLLKAAAVMENAAAFLATGKSLTSDENIYDSPADEARAKALLAQEAEREEQAKRAREASKAGGASFEQAQQAALHPVLEPAFQFGLAMGTLAAMMGGPHVTAPLVTLDVNASQGESALRASYSVDMERSHDPLRGEGSNDNGRFADRANLVDGKLQWQSQAGGANTTMVVEVNDDERSVQLSGQLCGVNANLRIAPFLDGDGNIQGIETRGLLNGEQYFMKSTVEVQGLLWGHSERRDGAMHVVGLVNGQAVDKSYQVSVHRSRGNELHLSAHGVGLNAGQTQAVGVEVSVKDRS